MSKSVRVSPEFHEFVKSHKRDEETMEETLRRLIGGPDPDDVAGIFSEATADAIESRLETKHEKSANSKRELRDEFDS